jgi:hypothetical protein
MQHVRLDKKEEGVFIWKYVLVVFIFGACCFGGYVYLQDGSSMNTKKDFSAQTIGTTLQDEQDGLPAVLEIAQVMIGSPWHIDMTIYDYYGVFVRSQEFPKCYSKVLDPTRPSQKLMLCNNTLDNWVIKNPESEEVLFWIDIEGD